jgi:hypothetical protein
MTEVFKVADPLIDAINLLLRVLAFHLVPELLLDELLLGLDPVALPLH